eukprot:5041773-Pyramimonas_sp.AAC.1
MAQEEDWLHGLRRHEGRELRFLAHQLPHLPERHKRAHLVVNHGGFRTDVRRAQLVAAAALSRG